MINELYFEQFPELETDRILLRKLDLSHTAAMQFNRKDEKVMRYMDSDLHLTLKNSENFITENLEMYATKKGLFWALIDKVSNNYIGDFSFWNIDTKNSRTEIGYLLSPQFWGKGLMKEAMLALFNFGFKELNLHSFEANINPANEKSRSVLLSVGFRKEAYFKENYYFNGKYLDSEIYSLLLPDFINSTT